MITSLSPAGEAAVALLQANSGRTYTSIAAEVGLSRERIRQLAVRLGVQKTVSPRGPYYRVCEVCGDRKQVQSYILEITTHRCRTHAPRLGPRTRVEGLVCALCGVTFDLIGKQATQFRQTRKRHPNMNAWCPACARPGKQTVTRACAGCGKPITRTEWPSVLRRSRQWVCSPKCCGMLRQRLLKIKKAVKT